MNLKNANLYIFTISFVNSYQGLGKYENKKSNQYTQRERKSSILIKYLNDIDSEGLLYDSHIVSLMKGHLSFALMSLISLRHLWAERIAIHHCPATRHYLGQG